MDNPIFRHLQAAIERPCRSRDWFGLAEQAINTIYALGEHPDVLCTDIVKKLTLRAFSRRSKTENKSEPQTQSQSEKDPDVMDEDHPGDTTRAPDDPVASSQATQDDRESDVGDAFELSQLLFVVGHVAIKHIVYLELVEREWKRQKDEKQASKYRIAPSRFRMLTLQITL